METSFLLVNSLSNSVEGEKSLDCSLSPIKFLYESKEEHFLDRRSFFGKDYRHQKTN